METTNNLNSQEKHPISTVGRARGHRRAAPWSIGHTAQTGARGEHVLLRWKLRNNVLAVLSCSGVDFEQASYRGHKVFPTVSCATLCTCFLG